LTNKNDKIVNINENDEKDKNNVLLINTNNNENNKEKLNDQEKNIMIADDLTYNIINSAKTKNKDNNDYLKVSKYKNIKKDSTIYINDIIVLS
jgi:hypothetical protein